MIVIVCMQKTVKTRNFRKNKGIFSRNNHTVVAIFAGGNRAVYGISEKL